MPLTCFSVVTVLVALNALALAARTTAAPETGPPSNLRGGPYQSLVESMWHSSPTFRRQCLRLAAERTLTVTVRADAVRVVAPARARTLFSRRNGRLSLAEIVLLTPRDPEELIAHEVEHVIEQLEGVQLRDRSCEGDNGHADLYESCRAVEVGRTVAGEVRAARAVRVLTVPQRDGFSGPLDPPTANISAGGRYVVIRSNTRLLPNDRDDQPDLYLLDLETGEMALETHRPGWAEGMDGFFEPAISGDGRILTFRAHTDRSQRAGVSGWRVVVRDRQLDRTEILAPDPLEGGSRQYGSAVVSADGGTVAFETATLGEPSRSANAMRVYLVRLASMQVEAVSVDAGGTPAHGATPVLSGDGRYVAFMSRDDLSCGPRHACDDRSRTRRSNIYVRDTVGRTTTRIGEGLLSDRANGPASWPSISADGRFVAFTSEASNLVPGDNNSESDVFLWDSRTDSITLVSRRPDGKPGKGASRFGTISGDGHTIAFQSLASDLTCLKDCAAADRDINLTWDVFVSRSGKPMVRATGASSSSWMEPSRRPLLDGSGHVLIFSSRHPVEPGDVEFDDDLFIQMSATPDPSFGLGSAASTMHACGATSAITASSGSTKGSRTTAGARPRLRSHGTSRTISRMHGIAFARRPRNSATSASTPRISRSCSRASRATSSCVRRSSFWKSPSSSAAR